MLVCGIFKFFNHQYSSCSGGNYYEILTGIKRIASPPRQHTVCNLGVLFMAVNLFLYNLCARLQAQVLLLFLVIHCDYWSIFCWVSLQFLFSTMLTPCLQCCSLFLSIHLDLHTVFLVIHCDYWFIFCWVSVQFLFSTTLTPCLQCLQGLFFWLRDHMKETRQSV